MILLFIITCVQQSQIMTHCRYQWARNLHLDFHDLYYSTLIILLILIY